MPRKFNLAIAVRCTAVALLLFICTIDTRPSDLSQDITFRLTNIERRLDQLQTRVDFIERAQQNQAMNNTGAASNLATETVLELQRQHLSLAGQVVEMQKRMLDLRKAIDRLSEREPRQEKKEPPKEEPKPKPKTGKP